MKSLSLLIFWVALASMVFAQEEVVKVKTSSDKVVTVDVKKEGDSERTIKIVTGEDGDQKVIEWTDNGEIPDDIRKKLEDQNINVMILDPDDNQMVIDVDTDMEFGDGDVQKEVIVIKNDDGEVTEFEWDGEGEMPAEMKELLEEHDIELDELHEAHGEGHKVKMKMRKHKDKMRKHRVRAMKKGRKANVKTEKKYKVVTVDEDGNEKVMEWEGDEGAHGVRHMRGIHGDGENVFIMKGGSGQGGNAVWFSSDDDSGHLSDAYMGVQIGSADDGGAEVLEIMKGSPADKAGLQQGDIITNVNGARARNMEGLLQILNFFDPNDQVDLTVMRNDSKRNIKLTLGQRPDHSK